MQDSWACSSSCSVPNIYDSIKLEHYDPLTCFVIAVLNHDYGKQNTWGYVHAEKGHHYNGQNSILEKSSNR